jgi:hypothetical protein
MAEERLDLIIGAKDYASKTLTDLQSSIMQVGLAYLSFSGVKSILEGIYKAGSEAEVVWNQVAASLKRHNYVVDESIGSIKRLGQEMMRATGISDEEYGTAVQRLIDHNVRLADTHRIVKAATDLAAATDLNFIAAVDMLARANDGVTRGLNRYIGELEDADGAAFSLNEILLKLEDRFGGAAVEKMKTAAMQVKSLANEWDELKETLFGFMEGPTKNVLAGLNLWIEGLGQSIEEYRNFGRNLNAEEKKFNAEMAALYQKRSEDVTAEERAFNTEMEALQAKRIKDSNDKQREAFGLEIEDEENYIQYSQTLWSGMMQDRMALQLIGVQEGQRINAMYAKNDIEYLQNFMEMVKAKNKEQRKLAAETVTVGKMAYSSMIQAVDNMADRMVDLILEGKGTLKEIWNAMFQDFVKYFAQAALKYAAESMVGGLVKILGSIFDNPIHDEIAATQGRHYAKFFMQGLSSSLSGANVAGKIAGASSQGGNVSIEINNQGNQSSFENARDILPYIESLIIGGNSRIVMKTSGRTGGPDAIFA